jgi:N-acetylglucosamine kinase-like BadF-type ATPase
MIIIADSGSSKTDWRLINEQGSVKAIQSIGLNPHLISKREFEDAVQQSELVTWSSPSIAKVYFYGAGVTSEELQKKLTEWLSEAFKCDNIIVSSDLLAAGKAIYGSGSGVVGILGTGANSGFYDGSVIEKSIPPLGYILGDEGSGNALGKRLVSAFLREELSVELAEEFKLYYPEHKKLLINIYQSKQPGKLLASLAPFIHQHQDNNFIEQLIKTEFERYFVLLNNYHHKDRVGLVGSVAHYFSKHLKQIAEDHGINLFEIMKSPIEALTLHHQAEIS